MLKVTFKEPVFIDEKNLSALLSLTMTAALVEPVVETDPVPESKKRGHKPEAVESVENPYDDPPPALDEAPTVVKPEGKKCGRKSNAEKAAEAATRGGVMSTQPPADWDDLLGRFSSLIDADFDAAKGILDGFGVSKFSELPAAEYAAFDEKLTAAGV